MADHASTRSAATGPATGEVWSATARSVAILRTADSRGTGKSGLAEMLAAEDLKRWTDRDNATYNDVMLL